MSLDGGSVDRREVYASGGANGVVSVAAAAKSNQRLRLNPSKEHKPESYEGLQLDFTPSIFSSLERFLPPNLLTVPRDDKVKFMREILLKYLPHGERNRVQKQREYRQKIISNYQPLHKEIYTMHPASTFVPSFLKAISDNTEESFRSIMSEPSQGVFTFQMLQSGFCKLLLSEVDNFEKWVTDVKFRIMRPNTMNKYGAVLDDFGLETMLDKLMESFIRPISKVFFPEVGGATLDSHHGFVVEYGKDRDVDLGFHVDDSEVTLNVCLGKQFSGGELYFRGTRCDKHVNTGSQPEAKLYFIVDVTAMVLEPQPQAIESTYFYGVEDKIKVKPRRRTSVVADELEIGKWVVNFLWFGTIEFQPRTWIRNGDPSSLSTFSGCASIKAATTITRTLLIDWRERTTPHETLSSKPLSPLDCAARATSPTSKLNGL
uniref:Prolyl 4-hydroxylase alpha subunit domain-containing protein n=1 Tax=Cannabis sativa TaxID=3483 RepID=A0A803PAB9_CANSA